MIVPQYWAECRVQYRKQGRQITVRRFGWSDTSEAEAQANADARADEAIKRLIAGEKLPRREPKVPYNGAQGVPIREEIVARHGETIITRNLYGARCLNSPNVFFADIDFKQPPVSLILWIAGLLSLAVCATAIGWSLHSKPLGFALFFFGLLPLRSLLDKLHQAIQRSKGGEEPRAKRRIHNFLARHPEWNFRLYRTPAGLRVLATHRTFNPGDPDVAECFAALRADPVYVLMCMNQQCFRARVSAKPWRIGIVEHMRPRPGVWPIAPGRMAIRKAWIERYETVAESFAACTLLEEVGSGVSHPDVAAVQQLHDVLCRATSELPIA
ncbi:MAG: hypothetical protein ABI977_02980 [Acidobacteriota bacterium]